MAGTVNNGCRNPRAIPAADIDIPLELGEYLAGEYAEWEWWDDGDYDQDYSLEDRYLEERYAYPEYYDDTDEY